MAYSRLKARVRDAIITLLIVALVATILILPFYNPSMAVYMTIIAVGMSLALQKYLASFVGHFVIRGSGIFAIGDRIRIGTIKGDVKHIGLFHIILDEVGDDDKMGGELTGKIISVPNLLVLDQSVQNYSRDFSVDDEMITCGYIFDEIRIPLRPKSDVQKAVVILEELLWAENAAFIKEASARFDRGLPNFLHDIEKGPKVTIHFDKERVWIKGRVITPIRAKNELRTRIGLGFINRIKGDSGIEIN
ncbi:MAG: Mechanosensitive ion channel [Methanocella sp. PtaU1.Bin125]|nr:MAG: Mechanosensitive ion channel [Methanocella sp. PtaU1.Bin125]